MANISNTPIDPDDPETRRDFRLRAAGLIRDLLAARLQADPDGVLQDTRDRWFSEDTPPTEMNVIALLRSVAQRLDTFVNWSSGYQDSMPFFEEEDPEDPRQQFHKIVELVLRFVTSSPLREAADHLQRSQPVNWDELADWQLERELREWLNRLPESPTLPSAATVDADEIRVQRPNIVIFRGAQIGRLSGFRFRLLSSLVDHGHVAEDTQVIEDVYETDHVSPEAFRQLVKRTKDWLRNHSVPWVIRRRNGCVTLERDPSRTDAAEGER